MSADAAFTHPQGQFVSINGRKLWTEIEGAGDTTIVFMSGGPGASHLIMHPWFSPLADRYRLVYYDYLGRGRSERPDPAEWTFERDVADLDGLRDALGLRQLNIYGFSYGGLAAQAYASRYPDRVAKLVLANTVHSAEMWHENHVNIAHEIQLQYPELWDEILAMRAQGMRSFDPPVRSAFASVQDVIRFYDASNSKKRLTEPGMQNDDAYRRFVGEDVDFLLGGEMAGIDMRPELHKISARTLVLAGRYDRALYPKYQLQFKKHLPHADFRWMERSGSFSHVEEQDEVLRLLRAFF